MDNNLIKKMITKFFFFIHYDYFIKAIDTVTDVWWLFTIINIIRFIGNKYFKHITKLTEDELTGGHFDIKYITESQELFGKLYTIVLGIFLVYLFNPFKSVESHKKHFTYKNKKLINMLWHAGLILSVSNITFLTKFSSSIV